MKTGRDNLLLKKIKNGFDNSEFKMYLQFIVDAETKKIVSAVERKKRIAIVDWKYSILVKFWKMIPRWLWVRLAVKTK